MVKGIICNKYFNTKTGAVVKPVYDYDELGECYILMTERCYPVFSVRHHYVGYMRDDNSIVIRSDADLNKTHSPVVPRNTDASGDMEPEGRILGGIHAPGATPWGAPDIVLKRED